MPLTDLLCCASVKQRTEHSFCILCAVRLLHSDIFCKLFCSEYSAMSDESVMVLEFRKQAVVNVLDSCVLTRGFSRLSSLSPRRRHSRPESRHV